MEYELDRTFALASRDKPDRKNAIVSGGARGADRLAKQYAEEHEDIHYIEFKADWQTHGKKAGIVRNYDIVRESNRVLAFWNGKSKGTKHTIQLARQYHKPVRVVRF
jgi:hypothetical protein